MEVNGSALAKDCGVCFREFNEAKRCPRILECFHTVCTDCIEGLIKRNDKRCPFCREGFEMDCINDIRINEQVLDLTKYIRFLLSSGFSPYQSVDETDSKSSSSSSSNHSLSSIRDVTTQHLAACKQAQNQAESTTQKYVEMKDYLLKSNRDFEEKVMNIVCEITKNAHKKAKDLTSVIEELQSKVNEAVEKHKIMSDLKEQLDSILVVSDDELPSLYQAQKTNASFQMWHTDFMTINYNKEIVRQDEKDRFLRKEVKMKTIVDLLESCKAADRSVTIPALVIQRASTLKLTPEVLLRPSEYVKCLLDKGKAYVVHVDQARRRSSKIYISKDNKLCFSCMNENRVPYNVQILQYEELMQLTDPSSRLTYLELGTQCSPSLGRLYIRFSSDSPLARQFSTLCSGAAGPAYLNTKFLDVFRKGCLWAWVRCGDYENNDGSGGRELVPGQGIAGDGEAARPCLAGTLEGWWGCGSEVAAQFIIYLKDNNKMVSYECSGFVEEGFDILDGAVSRCSNISDIRIVDCGIVLSSSFS
ncbi:uncharacterized protein [Palaemon carinicauda]|uniref:uncharacterized protein n=1 Tax=Palaemon carinicauda TaxID=392227 RepID=UPI0035B67280